MDTQSVYINLMTTTQPAAPDKDLSPLQRAIKITTKSNTATEFAGLFNLRPMTISHWISRGVPLERALEIEVLTEGAVTAEELCPGKSETIRVFRSRLAG